MTFASIETCLVEKNGSVLEVMFNRPDQGNSLTPVEHEFLDRVWTEFEGDESLRVAILGAQGDRIFCSGNDFKFASEHTSFEIPPTGLAGLTSRFDREKPIIAAVNGAAAGGGFEVAMACDLVVCARHATFSLPEVKAGTYAGAGGLIRLPRQVGDKIAMEMILTGRVMRTNRLDQRCKRSVIQRQLRSAAALLPEDQAELRCSGSETSRSLSHSTCSEFRASETPYATVRSRWFRARRFSTMNRLINFASSTAIRDAGRTHLLSSCHCITETLPQPAIWG